MSQNKSATKGSSSQTASRKPMGETQSSFDVLMRELLGQMVNPPNTAIAAPLQQSISNLQGGGQGMANAFGIGGQGLGTTGGLQTREQLGLPDRSSYFTFKPTAEQVAALGAVPGITPDIKTKRELAKARSPKTKPDKKAALMAKHPEVKA